MRTIQAIPLLVLFLIFGFLARAEPPGIEIAGHINYKVRVKDKEYTQARSYRVVVSGCRCKIVMSNFPPNSIIGSKTYICDSLNVFRIENLITTNIDELRAFVKQHNISAYRGPEELTPDKIQDFNAYNVTLETLQDQQPPFSAADLLLPVWLAYGSDCYFQNRLKTRQYDRPFLLGEGVNRAKFPISADIGMNPGKGHLLKYIKYIGDGKIYSVGEKNNVLVSPYQSPFNSGFVEASYEVLTSTNIKDITVPLSFELKRYQPILDGSNTNDLETFSEMRGAVDAIFTSTSLDTSLFTNDLPLKAHVIDRRFEPDPRRDTRLNLQYDITNGVYPDISRVKERKDYKLLANFYGLHELHYQKRVAIYIIFVAIFLAPLLIWAYKRAKHTSNKT